MGEIQRLRTQAVPAMAHAVVLDCLQVWAMKKAITLDSQEGAGIELWAGSRMDAMF